MKTQNKLIAEHLKAGNSITPLEALKKFGCFRLSGRIFDLKQQGMKIKTDLVTRRNKTFAEYRMENNNV